MLKDKRFKGYKPLYVEAFQSHMFERVDLFCGYVIAKNATEAANFMRNEMEQKVASETVDHHPITIKATGIRGGIVERFIGWESLIMACFKHGKLDPINNEPQLGM